MGVNVEDGKIQNTASKLGCLVLKTLFTYLGSKVGENMSTKEAWKEVVDKVLSRLSKWKTKTLSIGGRFTLLKSVLGSMPIFHMSIFKVPSYVLKTLESIRSRLFNGQDHKSHKASWVKWDNVLTSKDKGGLGVASLYALNRAIHGDDRKLDKDVIVGGQTCWTSIVKETRSGINVVDLIHLQLGNGDSFSFWDDKWYFWSLESEGDYSVASIRKLIDEKRFPRPALLSSGFYGMFRRLWTMVYNYFHLLLILCLLIRMLIGLVARLRDGVLQGIVFFLATTYSHGPLSVSRRFLVPVAETFQHQRTKHIEIDIHFVRDADIFTKGLPSALFDEFRDSLSLRCTPRTNEEQRNTGASEPKGWNLANISTAEISDLETMLKEKTFTRLGEGDKANISNDSHVLRLKASTSGPLNKHSEKTENFHAVISTPRAFEEDVATPVELAKARSHDRSAILFSHNACVAAVVAAMNSDSQDDNATVACF
nr:RNA-directed DNA polymerase, eukaryota [Tanacetum cinerariifolium]